MTHNKFVLTLSSLAVSLLLITSLNSCKGSKGDPGPTGAQGNANVASGTITVAGGTSNWSFQGAPTYESYVDLTDNSITSSIISTGAVLVYESSDGGTTWTALPYTNYSTTGESYTTSYTYTTGAVTIWDANSLDTYDPPLNSLTFKIVAVASNVRKKNPNVNWNNYNDVVAKIGMQNIKESSVQAASK